jgi:hypothetical protein
VTEAEYLLALSLVFRSKFLDVDYMYPANSSPQKNDTRPLLAILGTDYIFACR